ncbi:MAG TPA: Uma2 family endonuclease [Spirochaetales bacterium]|nr:Uma2 family endonuclease [Spirochaetales bacterium]
MAQRYTNGSSALKAGQTFTVADWKAWPEGERWELINGEAFCMSPAPTRIHQKIAGELFYLLKQFLQKKPCEVLIAPIDVFLPDTPGEPPAETEDTVVQPDVLVVCDPEKLVDEGIRGAPDFIAEVLSPSTASKDLEIKKGLYEKHGVREYWIVKSDGSVFAWILQGGRYAPATEYLPEMPVPSQVLAGFSWMPRSEWLPEKKKN